MRIRKRAFQKSGKSPAFLAGSPLFHGEPEEVKTMIAKKTKTMGADIIKAKGRTHYGIATCVCYLADAVVNQRPTIASVSSTLLGEHGVRGVALSVPSVIGPAGVQQRIREKWAPEEYRLFFDDVERIRRLLNYLDVKL